MGPEVLAAASDRIRSEFCHRIGVEELPPSNAGL